MIVRILVTVCTSSRKERDLVFSGVNSYRKSLMAVLSEQFQKLTYVIRKAEFV